VSPTVSTGSTFITAAIVARERGTVQCYNVPSAFINAYIKEDMLMVLKGELADMMVQIAPQVYRKYITMDKKGARTLYDVNGIERYRTNILLAHLTKVRC
jgi:hypothetical protein